MIPGAGLTLSEQLGFPIRPTEFLGMGGLETRSISENKTARSRVCNFSPILNRPAASEVQ